jgi:peptidoglycan/xylan/chitin deacetylase (PgdA/CDA1 family)
MTAVLDILKAEKIPATFFVNTEEHNPNPIVLPFSSKPVQVCCLGNVMGIVVRLRQTCCHVAEWPC